jgi:hypothetical protein
VSFSSGEQIREQRPRAVTPIRRLKLKNGETIVPRRHYFSLDYKLVRDHPHLFVPMEQCSQRFKQKHKRMVELAARDRASTRVAARDPAAEGGVLGRGSTPSRPRLRPLRLPGL